MLLLLLVFVNYKHVYLNFFETYISQAAFLSALVGVDVAEAAAHAAVWALYDDFNGSNFKEKAGSLTSGSTRHQGETYVLFIVSLILLHMTL